MTSIAERVAHEVLENTGKKKRMSITEIAMKHGASRAYAKSGELTKTRAFQAIIGKFREETALALQKKVKKSLAHITNEKLEKSSAKDLMNIVDTGIKNVQVLTGGSTGEVSQPILITQHFNFNATKIENSQEKDRFGEQSAEKPNEQAV